MSRTGVITEIAIDGEEQADCIEVCVLINALMRDPPCTYENFEKFHFQCVGKEECQGRLSLRFFDEKCPCLYNDYVGQCSDGYCGVANQDHHDDCRYWNCERCARLCGCNYESTRNSCRDRGCRNQEHVVACRHYYCEDCQSQSDESPLDAHGQDCYFNGCTTEEHRK